LLRHGLTWCFPARGLCGAGGKRDFAELEDGKSYVAAGRDPFKRVGYDAIVNPAVTLLKDRQVPRQLAVARRPTSYPALMAMASARCHAMQLARRRSNAMMLPPLATRVVRSGRSRRLAEAVRAFTITVAANGDLTLAPVKVGGR
jgi:hypothetical protein